MEHSNEMAIISLCMNGQTAETLDLGVTPSMFAERNYGLIFEAIKKCFDDGDSVDLPNVGMKLADRTLLTVLMDICEKGPSTQNVKSYIDEMVNTAWILSTYRSLADVAKKIKAWKSSDPIEPIKMAIEAIKDLGAKEDVYSKRTDENATSEWLSKVESDATKGGLVGIPTGVTEIDLCLQGGMRPGQMITIAARTGVGKTALATNMALAAAKAGHRVQYFSIELLRDEIMDRLACAEMAIGTSTMTSRNINANQFDSVYEAGRRIAKLPITIETKTKKSWENVESLIRREKRLKDLKVAFIDYIQQFKYSSKKVQSRREELTEMTGDAKELALELGITIVLVAQLNRNADDAANSVPKISDLKESGSIEQDSNAVILLFNTADDKRMGLMVGKNRSGKKDRVLVNVDLSINKFYAE